MPPITTNVDQKALRTTKFPSEFKQKVDTQKINVQVIFRYAQPHISLEHTLTKHSWAAEELTRVLGFDDEIIRELVGELLSKSRFVSLPASIDANASLTIFSPTSSLYKYSFRASSKARMKSSAKISGTCA